MQVYTGGWLKINFLKKSMQRDDSDIYTKQSESIFQENSDNIYIR